jgi:DNA invertase Pin-like site-specific DNA recombinase
VGDVRFVAYCRSSTPKQTIGLEMQQTAIDQYVHRTRGELIDWYQDVGSASPTQSRLPKQQPQLVRAISRARAEIASLIVARLDRLTRSTAVLALLLESGPPLLVVETPNASLLIPMKPPRHSDLMAPGIPT